MARVAAFLRGINVGGNKKVPMAQLREALAAVKGLQDPRTYVASGNVVVDSALAPGTVAARIEQCITETFGFDVDVLARTEEDLAAVVAADPHAAVADNGSRSMVAFLPGPPRKEAVQALEALVAPPEALAVVGRELYLWYPDGVAASPLAKGLTPRLLGSTFTVRNWNTVVKVLEMLRT